VRNEFLLKLVFLFIVSKLLEPGMDRGMEKFEKDTIILILQLFLLIILTLQRIEGVSDSDEILQAHFSSFDANQDKVVTAHEFIMFKLVRYEGIPGLASMSKEDRIDMATSTFNFLDMNRDGKLYFNEYKKQMNLN
jgi:Ca2+-binding EF-hand superfamily protein